MYLLGASEKRKFYPGDSIHRSLDAINWLTSRKISSHGFHSDMFQILFLPCRTDMFQIVFHRRFNVPRP
ncbi:hypothetical protein BRADI_4g22658v3 [Brachypodium distachyon]|uniref:Uncharacterized protein n=1 Tax=Brachypodium distachyon TaxID=15368 RepID=A0A0Q3IS34_BRADI|nr:hypothetical protein BRADI_4g22658v3 [Brachypodium distachyon]